MLNGKWYIFGGVQNYTSGDRQINHLVNSIYEFDPTDNAWNLLAATNPDQTRGLIIFCCFSWIVYCLRLLWQVKKASSAVIPECS